MRRTALAIWFSLLAGLLVAPVSAGSASCEAVPNTVVLGSDFDLNYSGLTGDIWYRLRASQSTEHFGHHPDLVFITDPSGSGAIRVPEDWPNVWNDPREALEVGSVKVRFYPATIRDTGDPAHTGNGPTANCQFTVV